MPGIERGGFRCSAERRFSQGNLARSHRARWNVEAVRQLSSLAVVAESHQAKAIDKLYVLVKSHLLPNHYTGTTVHPTRGATRYDGVVAWKASWSTTTIGWLGCVSTTKPVVVVCGAMVGLELEFVWNFMFGLCHDVTPLDKGHSWRLLFPFLQEVAQDESHTEPKMLQCVAVLLFRVV